MHVTNFDRTVDAEDEAIEQEEDNKNEVVEVAKDGSDSSESVQVHSIKTAITRADIQITTKNIERQMVSEGDPISQKNATSGLTLLFLGLIAITVYFLYSESDVIQSALGDMWDKAVVSYSKLYYEYNDITDSWYYSMIPEIETIQPNTPFYSAVDEPYVPTDTRL